MTSVLSKWDIFNFDLEDGSDERSGLIFDPHKGQCKVCESEARFKALCAGRRFGKSRLGGNELIPEAFITRGMANQLKLDGKRREFWAVGPAYSDSEKEFRVFYNQCKRLEMPFDRPGTYYSLATGDMTISLWDGAFIFSAKSTQYPDRLVGEGLSGVIMCEAARQKERIWLEMIRPTLADFGGWALFSTTPQGKNWFHKLFMKSLPSINPEWFGYRGPSWRNNYVYTTPTNDYDVKTLIHYMDMNPSATAFEIIRELRLTINYEIAQLANDLTIPAFQQEIAAEFTDFVGKVFKEFDDEIHVRRLEWESGWETVAAVDYGFANPNVWLLIQIGPWGEINVLEELYQENLAPDEFAHEILRRGLCPDECHEFYPDPASPGDTKTMSTIFLRAGKRIRAKPHTGGELDNRLNLIRLALRNKMPDSAANEKRWLSDPPLPDLKRPQLLFNTTCTHCHDEFSEYSYPERKEEQSTKRQNMPMKKDDHTPEALGRMLAGKYHDMATQYGGGPRISHARFLRAIGSRRRYLDAGAWSSQEPSHLEPSGIRSVQLPKNRGGWRST
jgi:hypothetical protein